MSILSNIFGKIFQHNTAGTQSHSVPRPGVTQTPVVPAAAAPASAGSTQPVPTRVAPTVATPPANASQSQVIETVDVETLLNGLASKASEKLNWRSSIVDLLKLLDLDSSLSARKELAQELHYRGDMNDSASMNIWLHKQVMKKLAENGGKLPADLRD